MIWCLISNSSAKLVAIIKAIANTSNKDKMMVSAKETSKIFQEGRDSLMKILALND